MLPPERATRSRCMKPSPTRLLSLQLCVAINQLWPSAQSIPAVARVAPLVVGTSELSAGGRLRSGTSYAAPFVTAVLAARRAERPDEPLAESLAVLSESARDLGPEGPDPIFGEGLIRADFICSD